MTATLEAPVSQPEPYDLFMCRRSELRLTKVARYPIMGPGGQKTGEHPGQAIAFRDGVLRVPHHGVVTLEDGREVDADDVRRFLLGHKLLGDWQEGFWRVDPVAPPVSQAELDTLLEAGMAFDEAAVTAIIEAERAGWNREALINAAVKALDGIQRVNAEAARRAGQDVKSARAK
jgi:hypothetical protein